MFLYKFPFGPLQTNALLIGCPHKKRGAVIDPALGSTAALLAQARKHGLTIEAILLTHSHWDHIADLHALKEETKAPVYVHLLDRENVEHPGSDKLSLFFPIEGTKVDHLLVDGQVIALGDLAIHVIHTPGHSPGGVCFHFPHEKILISGDTLFKGTLGKLTLPTSEAEAMWTSLKKLAKLPPETRVVPGHGADTTIGAESWLNHARETFS